MKFVPGRPNISAEGILRPCVVGLDTVMSDMAGSSKVFGETVLIQGLADGAHAPSTAGPTTQPRLNGPTFLETETRRTCNTLVEMKTVAHYGPSYFLAFHPRCLLQKVLPFKLTTKRIMTVQETFVTGRLC